MLTRSIISGPEIPFGNPGSKILFSKKKKEMKEMKGIKGKRGKIYADNKNTMESIT